MPILYQIYYPEFTLFKVAPTALENAQVVMTVFNGKVVYDRSKVTTKNEKVTEVADGHDH